MSRSADFEALRLALRARLRDMPNFPGDENCAWENQPFTPPTGLNQVWLKEFLVTGDERVAETGFEHCIGLYWIYANVRIGSGTKAVHEAAQSIKDAFRPPASISDPPTHIFRCERQAARMEGRGADGTQNPVWFSVPVLVYWRLFAAFP